MFSATFVFPSFMVRLKLKQHFNWKESGLYLDGESGENGAENAGINCPVTRQELYVPRQEEDYSNLKIQALFSSLFSIKQTKNHEAVLFYYPTLLSMADRRCIDTLQFEEVRTVASGPFSETNRTGKNKSFKTEAQLDRRPRIPQIRVSNTRLAQAASGCAPSVDVLPIFDVKQQSVRNPARMGANQPSRFSYNNKRLGCICVQSLTKQQRVYFCQYVYYCPDLNLKELYVL
ncbi:hypothetical protein WN51_10316 [Melipona quadrifasciata]|uniref:Uncharacterized protein n=1 Tax=Melipona quadrifasciata TaxID=166423 RepID=A0A0M9A634_9HYME|nr:hypothetical protein WN51_10316 [Melipona quadrifasciata]